MTKLKVKKEPQEKKEEGKWPKSAALYVFKPESGYTCDQCVFYNDKKCKLFSPAEKISPEGSCNMWVHGHAEDYKIGEIGVLTKAMTGYEDQQGGFACKNCEYFQDKTNSCEQVDKYSEGDSPGIIHPMGCCNRWKKMIKKIKKISYVNHASGF